MTEYRTTWKSATTVGVDEAMRPTPPEGEGWRLVPQTSPPMAVETFFYFWERDNAPAAGVDRDRLRRVIEHMCDNARCRRDNHAPGTVGHERNAAEIVATARFAHALFKEFKL